MPGCSAKNCTNSGAKGFKMCRIPWSQERRKVWLEKINRPDWIAGLDSCLCEVKKIFLYNIQK